MKYMYKNQLSYNTHGGTLVLLDLFFFNWCCFGFKEIMKKCFNLGPELSTPIY